MPIIRKLNNILPNIHENVFLAETAVIIGDVEIKQNASIWYNVVLRGDVNSIVVGENTNIQDGSVVHCTINKSNTIIGNSVTVGHSAIVHGCTIEDFVLIGMGAKVLDLAHIPSDVIVAAGALVLENQQLESGYLYAGVPAKKIKPLSKEHIDGIRNYANQYKMYSEWYMS